MGIVILVLWFVQWLLMKRAPGGFSRGDLSKSRVAMAYNMYNMAIIVAVIPLTAIILIVPARGVIRAIAVTTGPKWLTMVIEAAGILVYLFAHILTTSGRYAIGMSFQSGGLEPRRDDRLVVTGVYAAVRHPMYLSVLCYPLGLAMMLQSWLLLLVCFGLFAVILWAIRLEERQLEAAYGQDYLRYQKRTKALIPFVY